MELVLERGGRFRAVNMEDTPVKCGAMRNKSYEYFVRIEAFDTRLSKEGFLLNNELVQAYFDVRFGMRAPRWKAFSCENMARTAAQDLCKKLVSEGIAVTCVTVTLTGSNGAKISAKCKPEDGISLGWRPYVQEGGPEGYEN